MVFNAFKNLIGGQLDAVEDNKFFILNRWASFNPPNANITSRVDRLSLACKNKDLLKYMLYAGMKKQITKFLKAEKEDKELAGYLMRHYGWSSAELRHQLKLINTGDSGFLAMLARKQGWDKKTCKKFNVKWTEPKKEKLKKEETKPKGKSLFDF